VALAGWATILLAPKAWWLAPGAVSGFVLVAPILCTGLYELSRLLGRGQQPGLADAAHAWRRDARPLVGLGLLLTALGTAWVLASSLLFWLFVKASITTPLEFIRYAVVGQGHLAFSLWLLAGGLGSALVFAITAVSPPLLLGRRVGLRCGCSPVACSRRWCSRCRRSRFRCSSTARPACAARCSPACARSARTRWRWPAGRH
jgi:uncharacterized membrane protein